MQYIYTPCELPSNGMFYPTTTVRLRPKTIFEIKTLLNNPIFNLKNEIDALQSCIDPNDHVNVYDLVNQDVVFLLYKLRSLSDDVLKVTMTDGNTYPVYISELEVKKLEVWDHKFNLPKSGIEVELDYRPIRQVFSLAQDVQDFKRKFPDFQGDIANVISICNAIARFGEYVNKDIMRPYLEELCWEDSLYLIREIEKQAKLDFGVVEEAEITLQSKAAEGQEEPTKVRISLVLNEEFFRPALNS